MMNTGIICDFVLGRVWPKTKRCWLRTNIRPWTLGLNVFVIKYRCSRGFGCVVDFKLSAVGNFELMRLGERAVLE